MGCEYVEDERYYGGDEERLLLFVRHDDYAIGRRGDRVSDTRARRGSVSGNATPRRLRTLTTDIMAPMAVDILSASKRLSSVPQLSVDA